MKTENISNKWEVNKQIQTIGMYNDEQNTPNQNTTSKNRNGKEYVINLMPRNSKDDPNDYDTLKRIIIKATNASMDRLLYLLIIKIDTKTISIRKKHKPVFPRGNSHRKKCQYVLAK